MKTQIGIVTGASSGIGAAIATGLSAAGMTVIGTSRKQDDLARLDVTDPASCEALVADVLGRHGRIDLLVNNAGFAQIGAFDAFDEDDIRAAFETNVFGAMRMTRAVLPAMRSEGQGRIVNICSVVSFLPAPFMGPMPRRNTHCRAFPSRSITSYAVRAYARSRFGPASCAPR